jgi:hypothetical protein
MRSSQVLILCHACGQALEPFPHVPMNHPTCGPVRVHESCHLAAERRLVSFDEDHDWSIVTEISLNDR